MVKVLAVDDEPGLRMVYKLVLTHLGYSVQCARNVADAKQHIASEIPDVVVLDHLMPDGNGDVLLDWLSQQNLLLPVVLVSGQVGTQHLQDFPYSQIVGHLEKPFRNSELAGLIERAMNVRPAPQN